MKSIKVTGKTKKIVLVVIFIQFFLLCGSINAVFAQSPIVLRVTNSQSLTHPMSIVLEKWCKDLETRTKGRIQAKYYPAATLAPAVQQYDAVVKNIADVGNHVLGYTMGRFPLSEVLDLPLGVPNGSVATRMTNEYYNKFQAKEFDSVKVLWMHAGGPGYICTKAKAVNKLEDLRGLKLRTFGGNVAFVSALGATPVAMPMGDVYDALSRGVVDGLTSQYETLESRKLAELVKFVTENKQSAYTAAFVVAMNKKVWNSLPSDLKKIIDEMSKEYIEESGKAWDALDKSGKNFAIEKGTKFLSLSKEEEEKWEKAAEKPFKEYIKRMKSSGLPGEEALKFVRNYLSTHKN